MIKKVATSVDEMINHIHNQMIFSALFDRNEVVITEKIITLIIERQKYITFLIKKTNRR